MQDLTEAPKFSIFSQKPLNYLILIATAGFVSTLSSIYRLHSTVLKFQQMLKSLAKYSREIVSFEKFMESGVKEKVCFTTIFCEFPPNLFQGIHDRKRKSFYKFLECKSNFIGMYRTRQKQTHIMFLMDRPHVGQLISNAVIERERSGFKISKEQTIAVYGDLLYSKQHKMISFKTELLGLDRIELQKYWEIHIVSSIISAFLGSICLGIATSIYCNETLSIDQDIRINRQRLTSFFNH